MGASIDLSRAHKHQAYGDILAVFSWINDERALFLIPRYRAKAPWFVVMEPAAHAWSDQNEWSSIPAVIAKGNKACEVLDIEPNMSNVRRLIGIVNDAIPELVRMPHAPAREHHAGSYGQMVMRADGTPFASQDIKVEREGVTYG